MTKKEFIEKREAIKAEAANLEGTAYDAKMREIDALTREFNAETATMQREAIVTNKKDVNAQLREVAVAVMKDGQRREITLRPTATPADDHNIQASGAIEKNIQQMLPVLEKGLIWSEVGMKMMTGVHSDILWPWASNSGVAEEVGETVALTANNIDFHNKTATPYRVGAQCKVTWEAIEDAAFDVASFVIADINRKVARLLNKKTFGTPNFDGLKGPFANSSPTVIDGTYANIKAKKAKIAATGVDMAGFAYVCDNKTKALLETTPKANGQGGFIMENGKIDGDPVFVTEWINVKSDGTFYTDKYYLEMGVWGELAACQHGELRFVVDPYTEAGKNEVVFTLNTRFSLTNLATDSDEWAIYNLTPVTYNSVVVSGGVNATVVNTASSPVIVSGEVEAEITNTTESPVNTKEVTV